MDETCAADLSTGVVHRPPGHPDAWTTFPAFSDTSHVHSVATYRGRHFGKRCTRMAVKVLSTLQRKTNANPRQRFSLSRV